MHANRTIRTFCLIVALLGLVRTAAFAAPPGDDYKLVWHDEFNGNKLDMSKWSYRSLGRRKQGVNVKDAVRLDGKGRLRITISKAGDKFHAGMIATQNTLMFRYGYAETRIRFQKQVGHHSAFWIQSPTLNKPPFDKPGQQGVEIDVLEYLRSTPDLARTNLHWDGYGKHHKHAGKDTPHPGLGKGFHTVGIQWTPDHYTFYVDGKKTWRTDRAVSQRSEYFILSDEVTPWGKGDIHDVRLPDQTLFDYVRLYQRPGQKGNVLNKHPKKQDEHPKKKG